MTYADNRIAGDSLTVSGTANFADKNAGAGKTVTATGITLTGTDAANYTPNTTATTTATITVRTLAIGIVAQDKTYDGTASANVVYLDNRVVGDSLTVTGDSSFPDKNVGTGRTVTAASLSVSGPDAPNYSHASSSTTTATISRRPLAVTAVARDKRYDANNSATVDYTDDRINGDTFTVTGTAVFPDEELGTDRPVSVTGITLTGTDAGNYSPNTTTTTSADIFVRSITASVDSSTTQSTAPAALGAALFRTPTPTVIAGDLVPATDSRITFRRPGTADVTCDMLPSSTSATCTPTALTDGKWTFRSSQLINGLMVAASDWQTLTIDTTAPVITKPPQLDAASDSGVATNDNITNSRDLTVTVAESTGGDSITLRAALPDGTTSACSFTAGPSNRSCTIRQIPDGTWSVSSLATDPAGNPSPWSPALTVIVDTIAPAAPQTPVFNGALSTDPTPTLSVTGASPGDMVTINGRNTTVSGATASCAFVAGAATSCDMSQMPGGTWTITATATDPAGNVSPPSAGGSLIVSAALAPSAPFTSKGSMSMTGSAAGIVADIGKSAALANVKTVNFVVTNSAGKVIRRTTVTLKPTDTTASIQIPRDMKGAKVTVYTTNACGVSSNATKFANIIKGRTSTAINTSGRPTLSGDVVVPAIDFAPSETTLDRGDMARLDRVIKQVKGRCGTLLVSGHSRFNPRDSRRYLQNLADFRAQAVAEYLSSKGVDMWITYAGHVVRAEPSLGSQYRRVEVRWQPA